MGDCTEDAVCANTVETKLEEEGSYRGKAWGQLDDASTELDVKSMVERLLRTSSSVALAAARPLGIKPPLVLMVEQDLNRVGLCVCVCVV